MKKPWFTFAGICSLVLAIVLLSVVFGGYSSLVRAQSRIDAMRGHLLEQCRIQLTQVQSFLDRVDAKGQKVDRLSQAVDTYAHVLDRMEKTPSPLPRDLVSSYGEAQINLNHSLADMIHAIETSSNAPDMKEMAKKLSDLEATVFVTGKRYNKEARYFNTRTRVFPVFIVAKLFDLDKIQFHEIALERPKSSDPKETAGAS